jgi:hypothetical protein
MFHLDRHPELVSGSGFVVRKKVRFLESDLVYTENDVMLSLSKHDSSHCGLNHASTSSA